jgi:hypothetical protein
MPQLFREPSSPTMQADGVETESAVGESAQSAPSHPNFRPEGRRARISTPTVTRLLRTLWSGKPPCSGAAGNPYRSASSTIPGRPSPTLNLWWAMC